LLKNGPSSQNVGPPLSAHSISLTIGYKRSIYTLYARVCRPRFKRLENMQAQQIPQADAANELSAAVVRSDLAYIADLLAEDFTKASGKTLLITGGAGFLGYYMVQALLAWNDANPTLKPINTLVTDSFSRGRPEWLTALADRDDCHVAHHDITTPLTDDIKNADYIVHAASIASPMFYREHPIEVMDANVNGLRYLLDHMVDRSNGNNPVTGLLFFSTSEIYGDPDAGNIPTREEYLTYYHC